VWFAGKKMDGGKLIQDYLGRNEKTKAVVKLQEAGGLKPAREPVSCFTPLDCITILSSEVMTKAACRNC